MRLMRYSPTVTRGVRLRKMGPMSSKKVKMRKSREKEQRDDAEVGGVLAHDVVVEQKGELDAGDAAESAEEGGDVVVGTHVGRCVAAEDAGDEFIEADADGGEDAECDAAARHLIEKDGAGGGEEEVGSPDAEEGGELAGLGEGYADQREEVVDEDQEDGEDEAGGFASALGGDAEGDADEHEDEAGEGVGEALVELDAVEARLRGRWWRPGRCRGARVRGGRGPGWGC